MPEVPGEFNNDRQVESAEKEAHKQRVLELAERHTDSATELKQLLDEEGILIAAAAEGEVFFERLSEIHRRQSELIEVQGTIEREMASLLRQSQ